MDGLDTRESAARFTDCCEANLLNPAMNRWAIVSRPLRGLAGDLVQSRLKTGRAGS